MERIHGSFPSFFKYLLLNCVFLRFITKSTTSNYLLMKSKAYEDSVFETGTLQKKRQA